MTVRIDSIYISPVKSLALTQLDSARLEKPGIAGDRAFFIIDDRGKLFTQRDHGALVQVAARYDPDANDLALHFPSCLDPRHLPEPGDAVTVDFFGARPVEGHVVVGPWSAALSDFAGRALRLVKATTPGTSFDGFPISMCSSGSLLALALAAKANTIDGRRFRQNLYISGTPPHAEDGWIGRELRIGEAVIRVKMRDERCAITTHSPDTGDIDMNTLKIIASYRTDQPKEVNFGVYCTVVQPGDIAVGDAVVPPDPAIDA